MSGNFCTYILIINSCVAENPAIKSVPKLGPYFAGSPWTAGIESPVLEMALWRPVLCRPCTRPPLGIWVDNRLVLWLVTDV